MAATSVMSDRVCIRSNGTFQPQISAESLTTCCISCGGCQGSHLALSAFVYWQREGLVTGIIYIFCSYHLYTKQADHMDRITVVDHIK